MYRAYDLRLRRTVALKLVTPELAVDERLRERFVRETELAMSLEHPNVVPIHDAGEVAGRLYLAMRLVLRRICENSCVRRARSSPRRALAICRQVANALDAAHAGASSTATSNPPTCCSMRASMSTSATSGLTRRLEERGAPAGEGHSIGTPAYVAPEQIEGRPVDGRADVYSLGCLLFECLTGSVPCHGDSRLGSPGRILEEEPPSAHAQP